MPALAQRPPGISTSPLVTGPGAYGLSALANIIKGVHRPYRIALNGEVLEGEFTLIFADNGRWYGSGFHPAPDADPCDGLLDVLLVQPVSRLQVAIIIGKYKRGLYANYPELIRHVRTRHLKSNVPPLQKSIWMGSSAGRNRSKSEWQRKISAFLPQGSHLESPFQGVRICIKRLGGAAAASSGCIFQLYAGNTTRAGSMFIKF